MIVSLITTLVLISNIAFIFHIPLFFGNGQFRNRHINFIRRHILVLTFLLSLLATAGSLIFSNVIGFAPCELCWFQRIFMFPIAIVSFIALLRKEKQITLYILWLAIFGGIVALYQSLVNWGFNSSLLGCTAAGGECAKVYVNAYGYITIPFMSLSAFVYIITVSLVYLYGKE